MGTRADFYIGRGPDAEWLGSIAWDGYPSGIHPQGQTVADAHRSMTVYWPEGGHLFESRTEQEFRQRLACFFEGRDDVTLPKDGWPWPWENSGTTDYAYALDGGVVYASNFGGDWFDPQQPEPEDDHKAAIFPDMSARKSPAPAGSQRSGVMLITVRR